MKHSLGALGLLTTIVRGALILPRAVRVPYEPPAPSTSKRCLPASQAGTPHTTPSQYGNWLAAANDDNEPMAYAGACPSPLTPTRYEDDPLGCGPTWAGFYCSGGGVTTMAVCQSREHMALCHRLCCDRILQGLVPADGYTYHLTKFLQYYRPRPSGVDVYDDAQAVIDVLPGGTATTCNLRIVTREPAVFSTAARALQNVTSNITAAHACP